MKDKKDRDLINRKLKALANWRRKIEIAKINEGLVLCDIAVTLQTYITADEVTVKGNDVYADVLGLVHVGTVAEVMENIDKDENYYK